MERGKGINPKGILRPATTVHPGFSSDDVPPT